MWVDPNHRSQHSFGGVLGTKHLHVRPLVGDRSGTVRRKERGNRVPYKKSTVPLCYCVTAIIRDQTKLDKTGSVVTQQMRSRRSDE